MRISTRARTVTQPALDFPIRRKLLIGTMLTAMLTLTGRAIYLQVLNKEFLQDKADLQHIGIVDVQAYRGQIKDRNGEPLAISTPVQSIWMNMRQLKDADDEKLGQMAKILDISQDKM